MMLTKNHVSAIVFVLAGAFCFTCKEQSGNQTNSHKPTGAIEQSFDENAKEFFRLCATSSTEELVTFFDLEVYTSISAIKRTHNNCKNLKSFQARLLRENKGPLTRRQNIFQAGGKIAATLSFPYENGAMTFYFRFSNESSEWKIVDLDYILSLRNSHNSDKLSY